MTALYYTCIDSKEYNIEELPLSQYRKNRIKQQSNPDAKKQGIAGELLLIYALKQAGHKVVLPLDISCRNGKPYLPGIPFSFSISHSDNFVGCVLAGEEVGLDIQCVRECSDRLAQRWFSADEYRYYSASPDKENSFFKTWTMKESYVKATGKGIKSGFKAFSVDLGKMRLENEAFFWHKTEGDLHISLAFPNGERPLPDIYEYVPFEKLLF